MFSLETFYSEYETDRQEISINGKPFQLLVPQSIDRFINMEDPLQHFPLWAKIWPAGTVLASFLDRLAHDPRRQMLEIGSGIGLVGVVAAAAGHNVTITDYNPHALNFARANAALNGYNTIAVEQLDWLTLQLPGTYDMIVGSEVIYKEEDTAQLLDLFKHYLKPDGTIILAGEMRKTLSPFFEQTESLYTLKIRKHRLRSDQEQIRILLIEMQPRWHSDDRP